MVDIGAVFRARVERIEPYGVWLKHNNEDVIVLIPDLSWQRIGHPEELVSVGDVCDVFAMRYNYANRVVVGSLKALRPEENPYRKLARLEPGSVLQGKVKSTVGDELTI